MNQNDIQRIIRLTYLDYVNHKEYLQEGRTTPMSYHEYLKDLAHKTKAILDEE